ncbi:NYN domain-containing protein [soil metagenome]
MDAQSPSFLLVDGHSVIHAWEELHRLHLKSAQRHLARLELLRRLRTYQDMSGIRVVVVFDGTGTQLTDERETQGLQIFYADASRTADSVIERLVAKYAATHALRVATGDRMEWETVRALGADWLSPLDLRLEVERAEGDLRRRIKK